MEGEERKDRGRWRGGDLRRREGGVVGRDKTEQEGGRGQVGTKLMTYLNDF